mmetsp:Transcript_36810/g.44376  ORF Transcript_36810/g.44376 Transcript_36810/m.44376 type:complete len:85 (+) Transcript_36810:97-351(+)
MKAFLDKEEEKDDEEELHMMYGTMDKEMEKDNNEYINRPKRNSQLSRTYPLLSRLHDRGTPFEAQRWRMPWKQRIVHRSIVRQY